MIRKIISLFCGNRDGVAAVEFALIAPILFLIMVAVVDFGMYISSVMQTENITRSAAQYMVQAVDNDVTVLETPGLLKDDLMADVMSAALFTIDAGAVTLPVSLPICECGDGTAVDCTTGDCGTGDYIHRYVEVGITIAHEPMFDYPGIPDPITVSRTMRIQIP